MSKPDGLNFTDYKFAEAKIAEDKIGALIQLSKLPTSITMDPNAAWILVPIHRLVFEILLSLAIPLANKNSIIMEGLKDNEKLKILLKSFELQSGSDSVYVMMNKELASSILAMLVDHLKNCGEAGIVLAVAVVKTALTLTPDPNLFTGIKKCFLAGVEVYNHMHAAEKMKYMSEVSPYYFGVGSGISYEQLTSASVKMQKYDGNWIVNAAYVNTLTKMAYCALKEPPKVLSSNDRIKILHACILGDECVLGLDKILDRNQRKKRGKLSLRSPVMKQAESYFLNGESLCSFVQTIIAECLGQLQEVGGKLEGKVLHDISETVKGFVKYLEDFKVKNNCFDKAAQGAIFNADKGSTRAGAETKANEVKCKLVEMSKWAQLIMESFNLIKGHFDGMFKWLDVIKAHTRPFLASSIKSNDSDRVIEDFSTNRKSNIDKICKAIQDYMGKKIVQASSSTDATNAAANAAAKVLFPDADQGKNEDLICKTMEKLFALMDTILIDGLKGYVKNVIGDMEKLHQELAGWMVDCDYILMYLQVPSTKGNGTSYYSSIKSFISGDPQEKIVASFKSILKCNFDDVVKPFSTSSISRVQGIQSYLQYSARVMMEVEELFALTVDSSASLEGLQQKLGVNHFGNLVSFDRVTPLLKTMVNNVIGATGWMQQASVLWDMALSTSPVKEVGDAFAIVREATQTVVIPNSSPPFVEESVITSLLDLDQIISSAAQNDNSMDLTIKSRLRYICERVSERIAKTKLTSTSSKVQNILKQSEYQNKVGHMVSATWLLIGKEVMKGHVKSRNEIKHLENAIQNKLDNGTHCDDLYEGCMHSLNVTKTEDELTATTECLQEQMNKTGFAGVALATIAKLNSITRQVKAIRGSCVKKLRSKLYLDEENNVNRYRYIYVVRDGSDVSKREDLLGRTRSSKNTIITTTPVLSRKASKERVYSNTVSSAIRHTPSRRKSSTVNYSASSLPLPSRPSSAPAGRATKSLFDSQKSNNVTNSDSLSVSSGSSSSKYVNRLRGDTKQSSPTALDAVMMFKDQIAQLDEVRDQPPFIQDPSKTLSLPKENTRYQSVLLSTYDSPDEKKLTTLTYISPSVQITPNKSVGPSNDVKGTRK